MKKAITGNKATQVKEYSPIDEYTGKLGTNLNKGLMRSVIENDKSTIENGKLIQDSINQGLASFTPSTMFEQLVKNYTMAKKIFGESLLRKITGYEPSSLEQNIKIPEFQRELLNRMEERFEKLKEDKLIDREGKLTERAIDLASIILYVEEIENIMPKGITGERISKKEQPYGEKDDIKEYRKNKYRDISIRKSLGRAARRGHQELITQDLMAYKRKGKDQRSIIYCIDASGSMKGEKLEKCKKAGVALAFKAISEKDKAGLIIFGTEIKASIAPTQDFAELLKEITKARASAQTDISKTIKEATNDTQAIYKVAEELLNKFTFDKLVRLVGVRVGNFIKEE